MERLRNHIEQISALTDEEFAYVKSFFKLRKVRKHQYLFHEGDDPKYEYLVLSGLYKVFYLDEVGKEYIFMFAFKDWWMADYHSFYNGTPATMYLECLREGEVLSLTLDGRERLSTDLHQMEHFFRVKLTHGFVALQQRIRLLLCSQPRQRYEQFYALYPELVQLIPKKYIAAYIGVSRETLSRLYTQSK